MVRGHQSSFPGRVIRALFVSAALAAITSPTARGQSVAANIGGTVTDDTGGALPGVTISVVNKANGVSTAVVTGPEGRYRIVELQPAAYEISAELAGFAVQKRNITLNVGTDATLDFRLGVATVTESLTVTGEAPLVQVSKSQQSSVVEAEQLRTLPTITRNFLTLSQLLPGSGPPPLPAMTGVLSKFYATKFGGVADQRNGYTTLIDGGSVDDTDWGSPIVNLTQDAVQEFKVYRNQFDAEYGNALAAVVAVVSKSGTNNFGGTLFEFGRDASLNATNVFATTKPPFSQERLGGSFGGPIAKNRTHFFGAYEHLNVNATTIIALGAANPWAAQENGTYPTPTTDTMANFKLDHRATDAHSLIVRYAYDNQSIGGPHQPERPNAASAAGVTLGSNSTDDKVRANSLLLEDNWVISGSKVNTLRVHYFNNYLATVPDSSGLGISRPSFTWGQNTIAPQYFPRNNVTLSEALYINGGNHNLKFGGELSRIPFSADLHFNERGIFSFTTDTPFNAADPKTWPFSFTMQNPVSLVYVTKTVAAYAQDDWRIATRVRLNLGVRYDLDTNMRNNAFFQQLLADPHYAGINYFVSSDRGGQYNNVQPRLGATWDVNGTGTLVARGGFGMYVTRNRPWFDANSEQATLGGAVTILDQQRLQFFPDVNAVLGGQSLGALAATQTGVRTLSLLSNDLKMPRSFNSTAGVAWQVNSRTAFDIDYVHDFATDQLGSADVNLPPSGNLRLEPRPVPQFGRVTMLENYTRSWYDALEAQLRTRVRGANSLQVSYTLSKSWLDGVDFYSRLNPIIPGVPTAGYNSTDTRHNLSIAASGQLPWQFQVSAILRFISGTPKGPITAGVDLNGDGITSNDRPVGLPMYIGRENAAEELTIINTFRTGRGLKPIDSSLLNLDPTRSVDLRLTRTIALGTTRVELFLETFNTTNFVNYSAYNANMSSAAFLTRTAAQDPRQLQWGARFAF